MALEYFLYNTDYDNILVARSNTSFAPSPPYDEIHIDYFIPPLQPLMYYRESGGTIVLSSENTINDYVQNTQYTGATSPEDVVYQFQLTGYSATTKQDIDTRVFRSGDTMTGTLCNLSNILANGTVTGSSLHGSVLITAPVINASTSICAPQITGSTCIQTSISCASTRIQSPVICATTCSVSPLHCGEIMLATSYVCSPIITGSTRVCSPIICGISCAQAPITCGTTRVQSPLICGSTSVFSPVVSGGTTYAATCLCSQGITRLVGATTAASTLNVSGVTRFADTLYLIKSPTIAESTDYSLFWDPTTKEVQAKLISGGSTNYYYAERITLATTSSITPIKYLGYTGTTMPAGVYQIDFTEQVGQATSNNCVFGRFTINGVTQGSDFLLKMNVTSFTFTNTLSRDVTLSAGTNCFDMYYWNGGGVACATFGSIRIRKV